MQTKNVNLDREPANSEGITEEVQPQKMLIMRQLPTITMSEVDAAPPIPPRAHQAIIFSPIPASQSAQRGEVEGNGPYKPVPPPKPLSTQQSSGRVTPPPYRMPPYPLYNEPSIPGTAGLDAPSTPQSNSQSLQTHSSKFPIEREVILSSSDKNSKIPILNDYMKRTKGSIAPDVPPKQMSAWSNATPQHEILGPDQVLERQENSLYRATYMSSSEPYQYSANPAISTGAVPRATWQPEFRINDNPSTVIQIEKSDTKPSTKMTKTYHTIKDIISSKFKSSKDNEEKTPEAQAELNNAAPSNLEDRHKNEEPENRPTKKLPSGETGIYGKPRPTSELMTMQQYNQHLIQQHLMQQQQQQQQQLAMQAYKNQQIIKSQELLGSDYYQQRPSQQSLQQRLLRDQYLNGISQSPTKEEQQQQQQQIRSPQQLERDSLRQKSLESRRAASQPQLNFDEQELEERKKLDIPDNRPQPQVQRRGSQGNLVETIRSNLEDAHSDDGGFLVRKNEDSSSKINTALQGAPRKKLEGEIGKIEGVYNINQNQKRDNDAGRKNNPSSAASSDYDKAGQSSSNADSGRGSAAYSSGRRAGVDTSNESDNHQELHHATHNGNYRDQSGLESEWVDIVETELRHILEPKLHELSLHGNSTNIANSTLSESISSMTPPLPPLSPGEQSSPSMTPRNSSRYKHSSLPYGSKPDYDSYKSKTARWHVANAAKHRPGKKLDHSAILKGKQIFGMDNTDITSTTTRSLDLESMLDGQSDSDGDISTADARTIRKQLEGLESMYSEVLKLLGVKKYNMGGRYQPSDPRFSKRRYGSMSSLPSSSVSSRPIRDKRRAHEDRKKVRDFRGINKRFQRLESHVVTLARSVAHLSSEMRTQHIMIQEMENIRGEIAALRTQTNMLNIRSQSAHRTNNVTSKDLPNIANPSRVKKLTKFFGDEPPLLRLFLRKLGYEKYANNFENEKIGMVELPYLSEERLQKMGVPLGPRLRIMEEAQISVCKDNTLCIV